jgi:hypothetical protein
MTELRERMIGDMRLRSFADTIIQTYRTAPRLHAPDRLAQAILSGRQTLVFRHGHRRCG